MYRSTTQSTQQGMQGININGRIYYGTPQTIAKIQAKKAQLEARAATISADLRSGRMLPSNRSNQFAGWQASPCVTPEMTIEAKITKMIQSGRFTR